MPCLRKSERIKLHANLGRDKCYLRSNKTLVLSRKFSIRNSWTKKSKTLNQKDNASLTASSANEISEI